jgi:NAD(P)-dependent dehydrogenase (short-subunit alcohol dehydrogenase family)
MILKDKIAVVTGAGQGIGKASALALAQAGAHVTAIDINAATASQTAAEIERLGRRGLAVQADLGDVAEIDRAIGQAMAAFGRVDILVNNAGVTRKAHIMDLTEADWDRIHRINAKGVFFCLQRVAREMIGQGGGRIINIASIAGKGYPGASNVIYAASKGAVIGMTKLAAHQLGRHDITVNAVCPGIVRTSLYMENVRVTAAAEGLTIEAVEQRAVRAVPLQRANEPEDIADMVVFLAGPGARNITGQSFNVDGGLVPD